MGSTEGLVPITRAFLAKFYDSYPFDPIVPELTELDSRLQVLTDQFNTERQKTEGKNDDFLETLHLTPPHKIDENLWKNREQIEEIIFLLDKRNWPATLKKEDTPLSQSLAEASKRWTEKIVELLKAVEAYQASTSEKVFQMVLTYLPKDFRGTIIKNHREQSEKKRQLEIEVLLSSGGTIGQKYALLWQQQMDRRQTLASLGSASGVLKTLVKFLVGVPQVLLDFVKKINDHNGPMEEQRDRYGPHLYELTSFANRIHKFLALWWQVYDTEIANNEEYIQLTERAISLYCSEFTRFLKTIRAIFENSPFLISAEDAMTADEKAKAFEFKEVTIGNGLKHELPLIVEVEGSVVAWEFSLTLGKDVGFSVDFINGSGTKTGIVPYQRLDSHQGSFDAPGVGSYQLTWDNTYSYIYKKTVRFKVDAIPPVVTAEEVQKEEAMAHAGKPTSE